MCAFSTASGQSLPGQPVGDAAVAADVVRDARILARLYRLQQEELDNV